jgi:hypothetical protein
MHPRVSVTALTRANALVSANIREHSTSTKATRRCAPVALL